MSIPRSFIKGPRFAFRGCDVAAGGACVPCVFGERYRRGAVHTCPEACGVCGGSGWLDVTMVSESDPHDKVCSVCGGFGRVVPAAGLEPAPQARAGG